jgi:short-subunit dehydrogenase
MPRVKLKPLADQAIVIVGASSGIGLATARKAAAAGARVLLAARDEAALEKVVDEIRAGGGQAEYIAADVADEAQVEAIAEAAKARFGGFDTWVNAAGVSVAGELRDLSTEDHEQIFRVNYFGVVFGSLAAVKRLSRTGGALINIGSALSDAPAPLIGAYAASKHAVKGFTDSLRIELMHAEAPVSVTLIKPSATDTFFAEHSKSNTGTASDLPPPIYSPEVVAGAILYAAQHQRRDILVGAQATLGRFAAFATPRALDRTYASDAMWRQQLDASRPPPTRNNLYSSPGDTGQAAFRGTGRTFSLTTAAQTHPLLTLGLAVGAGALVAVAMNRRSVSRLAHQLLPHARRKRGVDLGQLTALAAAAPAAATAAAAYVGARARSLPFVPHRPSLLERTLAPAAPVADFARRKARSAKRALLH